MKTDVLQLASDRMILAVDCWLHPEFLPTFIFICIAAFMLLKFDVPPDYDDSGRSRGGEIARQPRTGEDSRKSAKGQQQEVASKSNNKQDHYSSRRPSGKPQERKKGMQPRPRHEGPPGHPRQKLDLSSRK